MQVEEVIRKALESTPRDATHRSTRSMAAEVGLSQTAFSPIWRAFGLARHRQQTRKLSRDPQFVANVRDVVGLYQDPPGQREIKADERGHLAALGGRETSMRSGCGRSRTVGTSHVGLSRRCSLLASGLSGCRRTGWVPPGAGSASAASQIRLTRSRLPGRRLIDGYQEQLITLEELRARTPGLRTREATLRAQAFRARFSANAANLTVEQRQQIVRLVVRELLIGDGDVTIRHSIPTPTSNQPPGSLLH